MKFVRLCLPGALALAVGALGACAEPAADVGGETDASTSSPDAGAVVEPFAGCDQPGAEARVVGEVAPPATMTAGDSFRASLTIANCGDATWSRADASADSGVKLGALAPMDSTVWNLGRVALPADVPPDHRVLVSFDVTAPADNGSHAYQWGIVDEGVRWIDDPSALRQITVTGGVDVPAADFHLRDAWQSDAQPVTGPSLDLLALRYITIHYNGDNLDLDGDDGVYQDSDYAQVLRNMQSSYLNGRGYSLGYNSGIAPDGDEWQIRGLDIRSAANGCQDVNVPAYAIQVTLPTAEAVPSEQQLDGLRQAIARVRAAALAAGNDDFLELNGHRDVRPLCGNGGTSCPGDALYQMIQDGSLEP